MIAATCYGLPVHTSLKPIASRVSEITPKLSLVPFYSIPDSLAREGTVRR
jgi:hypothetical protein